jgi:hypothetical protein
VSRTKALPNPRRCHYSVEKLPWEWRERWGTQEKALPQKHCLNYVNQRHPRKVYWQRPRAEKICWAYICDLCSEALQADAEWDDGEGWPVGEDGKFIGSMECSLP